MQYSAAFLAILAATGAMAAPANQKISADKEVRVILSDLGETGSQTVLPDQKHAVGHPTQSGPFKTVELKLGKNVQDKKLRCQILDEHNKPIELIRGANDDITFSDADKGPWKFKHSSAKVKQIICDESFKARTQGSTGSTGSTGNQGAGHEIRVFLSNQATETGSQTTFDDSKRETKNPVGSDGPFKTVTLTVGADVNAAFRCQILNKAGRPITVIRGKNIDTTFSDAKKGEWTLKEPAEVSKIVCDPSFKANPQKPQ